MSDDKTSTKKINKTFIERIEFEVIIIIIIIITIIIFINCNWVVTRWQWLFYMYTNMKESN